MKAKAKRKVKPATRQVSIPGLYGKGLIQSGKESRLELRDRLDMTRGVFGRVVNVSERTIAKVETDAEQVGKLRRPYNEVYRVYEALREVVDPKSLGCWFAAPNESFGGLKPIEVIERGEIDRLWDLAYRLRSGMPG
jgi:DNA-binding XRE family transcriptional regulator